MIEEYTGIDKVPVTCGFLSLCAALLVGSGFYFLLRGFDLCVCGTASFVRGFLLVTRRVSGWAQIQLVLRASSTFLRAELLLLCAGFFWLRARVNLLYARLPPFFRINSTIYLSISFFILPLTPDTKLKNGPPSRDRFLIVNPLDYII
ncbi:hypothetical protein CYOC110262_06350 [Cytobacillus oceanisediminis]|uniref:Uncharacterized protein n=1 Tax=Cytobacillus oceanisediminis TaxID=665099 RepID=A0A562JR27_9BACI|nr:hypothetical protein IQ19_03060 [Cytobacillus oceanisediminis]